jgi:hypothetical protein
MKFQTSPIKFILFSSIIHQYPFVLIQFPNNSHQIPLVPINNASKSICSHQVPKHSHQIPLVPINDPSKSFCFHQVPIKFLSFPSSSYQNPFVSINFQSAKQSAAVPGQAGRGAPGAGRRMPGAAEHKIEIFCLPGFVEDRGQICFSRGSLPCFFLHVRVLRVS